MALSETITGFKNIYDGIKIAKLTGKYGKANLVNDDTKAYKDRVTSLLQLAAIVQDIGCYSKNCLRFQANANKGTPASEALKQSGQDIYRRMGLAAFEIFVNFSGDVDHWKKRPGFVDNPNGADCYVTCIAHAVKLANLILLGKEDYVSAITRDILENLLTLSEDMRGVVTRSKVIDLNEDFDKWLSGVKVANAVNFVATRKGKHDITARSIDLIISISKELDPGQDKGSAPDFYLEGGVLFSKHLGEPVLPKKA